MSGDAWTLIGVLVGAAIGQAGGWLQRRWIRADRQRADRARYAEEFAGLLEGLNDWQVCRLKSVLNGEVIDLVPPRIFRLQVLLSAYFPDMDAPMREVMRKISQLQDRFTGLAKAVSSQPEPPAEALVNSAKTAMAEVMAAIGKLNEDIAKLLRKLHHEKD